MTCRRALDLDLADFVSDAARPEWAEFRAHYPRCAECSAEVRAWTELHLSLRASGDHPAEELLLRFETEPGRLPAAERRAVEDHLAHCASCRDELGALRRLDFAQLAPRVAASTSARTSFAEVLRRALLHPAFAYALVLLLLFYPALERRQTEREDRGTPAAMGEASSGGALRSEPAKQATARYTDEVLARRKLDAPLERAGRESPAAAPTAPAAGNLAEEKDERAFAKSRRSLAAEGWRALALSRPGAAVDVDAASLEGGLVLTLPVPETTPAGPVEVRVVDAQAGREMRQRFADARGSVTMRLPAAWLTPGTYTAELRRLDAETSPTTFVFRVVP